LPQNRPLGTLLFALLTTARDTPRRRTDLEAELLAPRHQLLVLQRQRGARRVPLRSTDRLLWVVLSRVWTHWRDALILVKPETVINWQRRGFRCFIALDERCLLRVVRSYVAYFGSVKEKVAPCPSPLSTQMAPPICSTAILQKGRPSPVSALAGVPRSKCWKRSKIL
jgi:hypothetical protein